MNIPTRRKSLGNISRSTTGSFIEGLAASYTRTLSFEPTDTRARRSSTQLDEETTLIDSRLNSRSSKSLITADSVPEDVLDDQHDASEETGLLRQTKIDRNEDANLSTTLQTTFNIINLLIGIGLLSLPLGIKLAGWILGLSVLLIGALVTGYTAILLARSLETKPEAYAYSDIGAMAYGGVMTYLTGLIFVLELTAAGSALTILFGDNFHAVVPAISSDMWKVICLCIMLPATLLPLRILSYTSVIGILSTVVLLGVVFLDGLWKMQAPGSLRDPLPTTVLPSRWTTFPLSIGLLMASFGGHGIFPQIYTDMQDRRQFSKSVWIAYAFSTVICIFMGVIGYLMFGVDIEAEITINLLKTRGYPKILNKIAILLTAITSLTKAPLTTKSISANIDVFFGLRTLSEEKKAGAQRLCAYLAVRVGVNLTIFLIAFFCPDFDRVMSVLGSAFVFLISVILPALFYLRIMNKTGARKSTFASRLSLWTLIIVSIFIATTGTVWAFLPIKV